jgi:phosphatidylglycerophosphatase A
MKFAQPAWPRSLSSPLILGIATLGPVGRRLPAPGTWGTLAGLLYFRAVFAGLGPAGELALGALGAWVAVGICGEAELRLGRRDPSQVILDEVAAVPFCFLGWPFLLQALPAWILLLAGFALFRFFDIKKPSFIDKMQDLPGGWGIVADDLAAALATCLVLHLASWGWLLARAN